MENDRTDLSALRSRINEIDDALVPLFLARMKVSAQVADYKRANGLPVRDEARERALLDRLSASAGDEMSPYVSELYERILALSRAYQEELLKR